jgi:hypothetical protein
MGLTTVVEEFEFGSYEIENMQLRLGGSTFRPVFVAFHPYAGVFRFEGLAHLVDPRDLSSGAQFPNLENGYVISAPPADSFRLMFQKPQLIVFLASADFARLKAAPDRRFDLTITGRPVRRKSANVTGVVAGSPGAQREIIVSAHLDAYGSSPGAGDNASGLGVLIELARRFKSMEGRLRARVKFVAFGAEELGVLGSRVYVLKHEAELQRYAFNLNVDDIGGPRCPIVETQGGVIGIPERVGVNLFPAELMEKAWQGPNGDWRLLGPRLFRALQASNRPGWLNALIEGSAQALGVKVIPSGTLGSDQLSFTQAGVVATGVGCPSGAVHSAADTSASVRKENLRMVGQLAACIVGTAAAESGQQPGRDISGQNPDAFSGERIARTVAAISEGADSAQHRSAILQRLDELNVKYRAEDFCSKPACGINVLVEPDRPRVRTLMLGAHHDRVSKGKGAVDDAAGVHSKRWQAMSSSPRRHSRAISESKYGTYKQLAIASQESASHFSLRVGNWHSRAARRESKSISTHKLGPNGAI